MSTEQTKPRRTPPHGGYARGDEKRVRIVEAALLVFGEQGYERASTRQIAQEAGVNPPALQYYFDGKEGLYAACLQHIADQYEAALRPAYDAADAVQPGDPPEAAIEALCGILDALADFLFASPTMQSWSRFLARGQSEGASSLRPGFKTRLTATLHLACGRLVGLASGLPPDDPHTLLRAIALLGQLGIFHLARDGTLATLGWPDLHGERLLALKSVLRQQTRAILRAATDTGH